MSLPGFRGHFQVEEVPASGTEERRPLRVLRLTLTGGETAASYNQFSLAWCDRHDITMCTYFPTSLTPPAAITLLRGDGTLRGFLRVLRTALARQEYDVLHAHTPHVALVFLVVRLFSRSTAPATVFTMHSSFGNYRKLRTRLLLLPVFATFQRVVCCSRSSFESVPALYRRLAGDRLCAVTNGVDVGRVDRALGACVPPPTDGGFRVAVVGRLIEIKNPLCLLEAFRRVALPTSRLVYVGDGPLRGAVDRAGAKAGLSERVELTGLIPRGRVYEVLASTDLFASASRGEGLPIAVLEAMACRRPVVLSDIPPHREIAHGAEFIPLVSPDDVEGFAREIERFQGMSAAQRAEIGTRCRALVEERFGLPRMHEGYERIYGEAMALQQPPAG